MSKTLGYVHVEINGEDKPFKLDLNAVADLEEKLDKGIGAIMQEENVGFRTIRAFYWAGLKWKDKGMTIQRAGTVVQKMLTEDSKDFKELMEPVREALFASGLIKKSDLESEEDAEDDEGKN